MNNNLFKTSFIPAVAYLLGACMEGTGPGMETGGDSLTIRFAGPVAVRTAVDGAGDIQTGGNSLSIRGSYTAVTNDTVTSVFGAEKVTCLSGIWGYEGTRYWLPGNTYDFCALYPSTETLGDAVSSVVYTDGTFTVGGFDIMKGCDLMTAKKTDISVAAGQTPGTVVLKSRHLLARLTFAAHSEGGNATVRPISLKGPAVKGDYDDSVETVWSNITAGKVSARKETSVALAGDVNVSGDLPLIPQPLADGVELTIIYDTDAETEKSASYTLSATTVSMWEAANHYRYSFTLTGGGYIVFDPPTANAQNGAIGGNVTINVTQQPYYKLSVT